MRVTLPPETAVCAVCGRRKGGARWADTPPVLLRPLMTTHDKRTWVCSFRCATDYEIQPERYRFGPRMTWKCARLTS